MMYPYESYPYDRIIGRLCIVRLFHISVWSVRPCEHVRTCGSTYREALQRGSSDPHGAPLTDRTPRALRHGDYETLARVHNAGPGRGPRTLSRPAPRSALLCTRPLSCSRPPYLPCLPLHARRTLDRTHVTHVLTPASASRCARACPSLPPPPPRSVLSHLPCSRSRLPRFAPVWHFPVPAPASRSPHPPMLLPYVPMLTLHPDTSRHPVALIPKHSYF
jgi:hypothetical protein